jgi:hypothetical protein
MRRFTTMNTAGAAGGSAVVRWKRLKQTCGWFSARAKSPAEAGLTQTRDLLRA